jgi:hypothetical protein
MRAAFLLPLLAGSLCAQSLVSPRPFERVEGNTSSSLPFPSSSLYRYLQVHDDVTGVPRTIRGLSFRRDGGYTSAIAEQAFVINGWMSTAATTAGAVDTTFAANHGTDKTQVLNNKVINFRRSAFGLPMPADFEFSLVFDTPFLHAGTGGLCWEIVIPSRAATASGSFDAVSGSSANPPMVHQAFGAGCKAGGATSAMGLTTSSTTNWSTGAGQLDFQGSRAPANALALVVLGTSNQSFAGVPLPLAIPGSESNPSGVCNIHSDVILTVVALATGTGSIGPVAQPIPFTTDLAGGTVFSQVWALDPAASLGIVTSNAYASHWVPPYTMTPIGRLSSTSIGSLTGSRVNHNGLVTRFDL